MSELRVLPGGPEGTEPDPQTGMVPATLRIPVVVHRMEGGLEKGESEARALSAAGFPIFTQADPDRPRLIPLTDIKYVVLGSVEDPNLEADPGDKATARKAILRFRDGEWIPAYMDPSQANDGVGLAVKIRLTERQRVIPAVASSRALLEMQFVDAWASLTEGPVPQRRRSDIEQAAARQGKDLQKLANDFRDRLALVRDAGLTTGDTLAFSRAVRTYLDRFLAEDGITLNAGEKSALADIILRAAVGYGPLDPLLHDRSVSEIMVNGPDQVFIERRGVLTKAEVRFDDENQLLETIRRMVATTGRHIDGLNPMVDARLPDGSRVNAIIRPASIHGPALTIRKFKDAVLGMDDLTREGSLSPAMSEFLKAAVLGRMNILVSGGTGSGKTTSLNVIARFIPHNQRVITIEDAAELQIDHPHVISLEHRPPNVEGKGELTIRQLLRNSLRMRPDRILVGEVRGSEALDMLQAMNTGHDGSMSTIHSNSARDALSRLETMVMMASIDIPFEAVRAQIASAVNLIVHQARMPDGRRKIAQIAEVVGYDQNGPILRDIFLLGMGGDLRLEYNATGYVPTALDKAAFYGVQVDQDLFDPVKARFIPAGSDSMMPVVKDPLISGQRGGEEKVVRQVVVVPFSSDRPGQQQTVQTQASSSAPAQSMASTPEMQEEMRKLIDAARSAVADLQAAAPPPGSPAAEPVPVYQPPPMAPAPQQPPAPLLGEVPAMQRVAPIAAGPVPAVPVHQISAGDSVAASQALQAATAMARATTELGRMAAAAQSGFIANAGMLPTVQSEGGHGSLGVSRRLKAVIESIVSNKNLNLRLAPAITQVFEGAELKASDYAKPNHLSKESAARELRQAAEAGLLEMVKYAQGEAGFRSGASLLREVAAGLGQRIDASSPLTADTIIGSLSTGQTEGTVSIMFTDVEGSTNLLSTRGFTESHEIMKAYETIVGEMITEHAGRRIKGLGDGVMVSFGSTRHAVECALAIQRAITDYSKANPHRRLRIRIGINTGEVVEEAGDIFGAAVNMAARVAGKAKGGQVLVSEVVRQLVGPVTEIDFTYRGHYKLKGFPDRWRLHEATPGEMPAAIAPIVTTPGDSFVGRAQEKLDIRLVLDRAATGTGGMILLAGAPGIGASRLVAEVSTEAARKGWIVLSGRCAEQEEAPYAPFRDVLAGAIAVAPQRPLQELAASSGAMLAELVPGLRTKVRGTTLGSNGTLDGRRESLFKAVFDLLVASQGAKSLLVVLDDLQWADEATVLLLRDIAERLGNSKIVLIGTYWETDLDPERPFTGVGARLLRRRRAQRIALGRLTDAEVEKMLMSLAGGALTAVQLIGIQAATEGNPLFVEHSYLYMAESEGLLGGVRARSQASYTEEDLELAQSVRGLIGRRLERLSEPAHRMLTAAAVIGRDFDVALFEAFGELSGGELREALEEATRARLLSRAINERYRFSHDLVRQRVLAGMPLPRLQAYHLAIADTLERVYGKTAKDHAAEIANHLYQAGTAADAMRTSSFLAAAAKNALGVGAYEEVLRLIESELMLLPANKTKDRASALAMRGDAFAGLGRRDEARSAWGVAAQRFEDSGDKRSASAVRSRLHASPAEKQGGPVEQAVQAEVAEPLGDGHEAQTSAEPVAEAQVVTPEVPESLS
ncbi:MAG TPA: ATPase, T2SS/T4P/T4SS family [Candidatus Polarisedimenticolia bacterium]|nr:ATPase, T2SS/T4P/T4SS family [Candidatus Polarisedimenticolia bacterium]